MFVLAGLVGSVLLVVAAWTTVRYMCRFYRWESKVARLARLRESLQIAEDHSRTPAFSQRGTAPLALHAEMRQAA